MGGRPVSRAASGRHCRRLGTRQPVPRAHCPLQAAARLPLRRRPAEEQLRQGVEDRTTPAAGQATLIRQLQSICGRNEYWPVSVATWLLVAVATMMANRLLAKGRTVGNR